MPSIYTFKDSKLSDSVSKALMFISKFSKKQAMIKLTESSVIICWSIAPKTLYLHSEISAPHMFQNRLKLRPLRLSDTIIEVDPSTLGRTMKGVNTEKTVSIHIYHNANKIKVLLGNENTTSRTITHTLPCKVLQESEFKSRLMSEMEAGYNLTYDVKCGRINVHRLRNFVEKFSNRLGCPGMNVTGKKTDSGNKLILKMRTGSAKVKAKILDLEDGFVDNDRNRDDGPNRNKATVNIDSKKVALFLTSMLARSKSKIYFSIKHNHCLKITLVNDFTKDERTYQSMLIPHSLDN